MIARRTGKLSCLTVHWPDVGTTVIQLIIPQENNLKEEGLAEARQHPIMSH